MSPLSEWMPSLIRSAVAHRNASIASNKRSQATASHQKQTRPLPPTASQFSCCAGRFCLRPACCDRWLRSLVVSWLGYYNTICCTQLPATFFADTSRLTQVSSTAALRRKYIRNVTKLYFTASSSKKKKKAPGYGHWLKLHWLRLLLSNNCYHINYATS